MRTVFRMVLLLFAWVARGEAQAVREPLSLADAVRRGIGDAPAVVEAEAGIRQASARQRLTRGSLLPSITGTAGYVNRTYNVHTFGIEFPSPPGTPPLNLVGPFGVTDARATLRQPLLDFAALARVRSQAGAVDVSTAARNVAAERSAETIAVAYVRAVRAAALVSARTADVDLAQRLATLAQAQLDAGLSAGIDVTRAQTQLAGARGLLLVAQNNQARAEIDLARAMGLDPSRRFLLTDTLSSAMVRSEAPLDSAGALQAARQRRPDLALERATMRRASLEKSAVRAERLPSIGVEGDWGFSGTSLATGLATRQVAVEVTLPVFDGLRREARIAEQDAVIDAAAARERDTGLQLVADVQAALLDIASAAGQEQVALDGLSLAQQEVSQAQERFTRGVAGNIEVINAQSSLIRARDAVIEARAAGAIARVRLARATGAAGTIR